MGEENNIAKGYFMVMVSAICWAFLGTFTRKLGLLGFDSISIAALRPTITAIFYIFLTLCQNPKYFKVDIRGLFLFLVFGLIAYNGLFVGFSYAVEKTSLSTAVILLYTAPIFVTILSFFFFKEPLTKEKLIALISTGIGCFLMVKAYKPETFQVGIDGILWGLLSGLSYAMQSILGKIILKDYSYKSLLVYAFSFSALTLWILRPPWALFDGVSGISPWIYIFGITFISTIIPNGLFIIALQYVEASRASIITNIEPMAAVLLALVIFRERLEVLQWIGMILIVFSLVLIQIKKNNKVVVVEKVNKI